jgi:hypothetical protein
VLEILATKTSAFGHFGDLGGSTAQKTSKNSQEIGLWTFVVQQK